MRTYFDISVKKVIYILRAIDSYIAKEATFEERAELYQVKNILENLEDIQLSGRNVGLKVIK